MRRAAFLLSVAALGWFAGCSSGSRADSLPDAASPAATRADGAAVDTTAAGSTETVVATTSPASTSPASTSPATGAQADPSRPFQLFTPSSYDPASPMPLVVLLHGWGASGDLQELYFQLQPLAESRGFLYVHPDGTEGGGGTRFWNATDACCGFGSQVDDVAYLTSIVDQVSATRSVDPARIYLVGHSNGGFMSYRMACERADRIAAVVSLAGATFADPGRCDPSEPVSVLQVHGTADGTVSYQGGSFGAPYPGALATATTWTGYDGCATTPVETGRTLDVDQGLPGPETRVTVFDGCPPGIAVELWTIEGGSHIPAIPSATPPWPFTTAIVDFLLAHPKP